MLKFAFAVDVMLQASTPFYVHQLQGGESSANSLLAQEWQLASGFRPKPGSEQTQA